MYPYLLYNTMNLDKGHSELPKICAKMNVMLTELPTPPRPGRHKATKISEAVSAIQVTTDIECTPKQLRFAEPASEKQGNDSPETEPSSTSATPRLSFQHAVEHTKSAMRYEEMVLPFPWPCTTCQHK